MKKNFKKSDLETGMYLELRYGQHRLVLLGTNEGDIVCDKILKEHSNGFERLGNYYGLNYWNGDLIHTGVFGKDYDVVRVYDRYGKIIWQREEPILTLDGVEYSEETLRSLIKKATS